MIESILRAIDRRPWGSYRELVGPHALGEFRLFVDRIPPDPFAGPAHLRVFLPLADTRVPEAWLDDPFAVLVLEDLVARETARTLDKLSLPGQPIGLQELGPSILERSACRVREAGIELRFLVHLPSSGRRIRGRDAFRLLDGDLRRVAQGSLIFSSARMERAAAALAAARDHRALVAQLAPRGLVAFLAEGSLLARAAGDDARPRRDGLERALEVPDALAVELEDSEGRPLRGLGIPAGVTVVVGGAFHGKSTLLDALVHAAHPKVVGDGRERVAVRPGTVPLRAEDGRPVRGADLSPWFAELPTGVDVHRFSTDRASGSTSQAASLVEALEAGARVLLIDEDRAASNFMIRDGRMQRLVPRPQETIVPFLDRARELYDAHGVSSVLVTGGSGDYLEVADTVIQMDTFRPRDRTADAREIVRGTASTRLREPVPAFVPPAARALRFDEAVRAPRFRAAARGPRALRMGEETVDLSALESLEEPGQVEALAEILRRAPSIARAAEATTFAALLDAIEARLDAEGLDRLGPPGPSYRLSRPRRWEIAAALARWRAARFERVPG